MSTRRFVTLLLWLHCFRTLVECELYHQQNWEVMWIPCPRNQHAYCTRNLSWLPGCFLGLCSGASGESHVQDLAKESSPHSPHASSAAGSWKTRLAGPLSRAPRQRRHVLAHALPSPIVSDLVRTFLISLYLLYLSW